MSHVEFVGYIELNSDNVIYKPPSCACQDFFLQIKLTSGAFQRKIILMRGHSLAIMTFARASATLFLTVIIKCAP